jgi:hypothetical protein
MRQLLTAECYWEYHAAENKTPFFSNTTVLNRREPSVAIGWGARYRLGGSEEEMEPHWIIGSWTMSVGSAQATWTNADLINARTRETPVGRSEMREGKLFLSVPGNRLAQIQARAFSIEIRCSDYSFKMYSQTYRPAAGDLTELRYMHSEDVNRLDSPRESL